MLRLHMDGGSPVKHREGIERALLPEVRRSCVCEAEDGKSLGDDLFPGRGAPLGGLSANVCCGGQPRSQPAGGWNRDPF